MEQVISPDRVIPEQVVNHLHFINVAICEHSGKFTELELEKIMEIGNTISKQCSNIIRNRRK